MQAPKCRNCGVREHNHVCRGGDASPIIVTASHPGPVMASQNVTVSRPASVTASQQNVTKSRPNGAEICSHCGGKGYVIPSAAALRKRKSRAREKPSELREEE